MFSCWGIFASVHCSPSSLGHLSFGCTLESVEEFYIQEPGPYPPRFHLTRPGGSLGIRILKVPRQL